MAAKPTILGILALFGCALAIAQHDFDFRSLDDASSDQPALAWWQTDGFYQIYPRSFRDSNGDGIGDLNGISERLPYLVSIGVRVVWLSPIFRSPMADFGYDIANYFDIQPEYGTLDDFDRLIERAGQLGIRVLLDFVPNHTSDENDWFRLSARRDPHFENFYVWHPGRRNASAERPDPPNNWVSVFGKSAWQWHDERQEYYLHQFAVKQPDLNYRDERVRAMMHSVLRFWLKRGVAGFRVDAISFLYEIEADSNGNYPDEPLAGGGNTDPNDWNYLRHVYTMDRPETVHMVYDWRATLDRHRQETGGDERVLLIECYSAIETVMQYYGNATSEGAQVPFNFALIGRINNASTAHDYQSVVDVWMNNMPEGRTPNWVVGNHDNNRVAARLGTNRIDAVNMILLSLPGVSVSYNGEEIGMNDVWISWADTVDPAACNTNASVYERYSRDPERTPFQWDDTTSAGFSTNATTWLPVAADYRTVNVRAELAATNSHLQCYTKMMSVRSSVTMRRGRLLVRALNDNVLAIVRSLTDEDTYATVVNIGGHRETVDLQKLAKLPQKMRYAVVGTLSAHNEGDSTPTDSIVLQPFESVLLWSDEPLGADNSLLYQSHRRRGRESDYMQYVLQRN